ncbi:hypothetical protein E2320_010712 [Naja naja]|nr:hypothetical protein E2320_010712 [Naja naja]
MDILHAYSLTGQAACSRCSKSGVVRAEAERDERALLSFADSPRLPAQDIQSIFGVSGSLGLR